MRAEKLISTVHRLGGILGLAHPYGAASSSAMGFTLMNMDLVEKFDFIEAFNTCEFSESNRKAVELAAAYDKPCFAGSDSHVTDYIGMAETVTDCDIRSNNDLIHAVKSGAAFCARGTEREITKKAIRKEHWFGIMGYKIYNRVSARPCVCIANISTGNCSATHKRVLRFTTEELFTGIWQRNCLTDISKCERI